VLIIGVRSLKIVVRLSGCMREDLISGFVGIKMRIPGSGV